jgi:hypothetical protein
MVSVEEWNADKITMEMVDKELKLKDVSPVIKELNGQWEGESGRERGRRTNMV